MIGKKSFVFGTFVVLSAFLVGTGSAQDPIAESPDMVFTLLKRIEQFQKRIDELDIRSASVVKTVNVAMRNTLAKKLKEFTILDSVAQTEQNHARSFNELSNQINVGSYENDKIMTALESRLTQKVTELTEQVTNLKAQVAEYFPILEKLKLTAISDPKIPVFRYNQVSMYMWNNYGWAAGNDGSGFGGVNPSQWSQGDQGANNMQADFKYLRRFLVKKGTADGYGATICSDSRQEMQDSNQETGCFVAFRIKNTKNQAAQWSPKWYSTSADAWGRSYSSIAVNGALVEKWECRHNNNWNNCWNPRTITLPANRISTVIFVSFMSWPYTWNGRQSFLLSYFADNSLVLPDGAEYVDDLDTVTGSWKQ